jgi:hypothetical protein
VAIEGQYSTGRTLRFQYIIFHNIALSSRQGWINLRRSDDTPIRLHVTLLIKHQAVSLNDLNQQWLYTLRLLSGGATVAELSGSAPAIAATIVIRRFEIDHIV